MVDGVVVVGEVVEGAVVDTGVVLLVVVTELSVVDGGAVVEVGGVEVSFTKLAPQLEQNFVLVVFSEPQLVHIMTFSLLVQAIREKSIAEQSTTQIIDLNKFFTHLSSLKIKSAPTEADAQKRTALIVAKQTSNTTTSMQK